MQGVAVGNHAAVAAWIQGGMSAAQRQEFAAHLATCPDCQAQVAALRGIPAVALPAGPAPSTAEVTPSPPGKTARSAWLILTCGVLILVMGFGLGWWTWHLSLR